MESDYQIIRLFIADNWRVTNKYDNFDAGIDEDFVIMEKNGEQTLFGWNNWTEGEIKCSEERMKKIEDVIDFELKKGEPVNLKPVVIALYIEWKNKGIFNNPGLLYKN